MGYFTDNESLLDNKLGISDPEALQAAEQDIVAEKTARLLDEAHPHNFDFEYLKHIHKVLFEDIYDFAGQIRTVDITKSDSRTPFAYAQFIVSESKRVFDELNTKSYLLDIEKETYISEIANLSAELNAVHPFREGNGRAIRLFPIILADNAGYLLDYSQVSSEELITADKRAFEGDTSLLLAVYKKAVITY